MPKQPKRRPDPPPEPQITLMPHISAPIDEAPLIPYPPWRLRDKLLLAGLLVVLAGIGLTYAFFRASSLR